MSDVIWTPELRLHVHASRAHPNPAFLAARLQRRGLAYPLEADACFALAAKSWREDYPSHRTKALMRTGLLNNTPHWRAVVEAALARCEQPDLATPLEVDLEAASITCHLSRLWSSSGYWVTRGGVAFAVRALARCAELTTYGKEHYYIDERGDWMVEDRSRSTSEPEGLSEEWPILRALIAEASDTEYAAARDAAAEIIERSASDKPWERGMLLWLPFAFPDEPAFAEVGRETALELSEILSTHKNVSDPATLAVARYLSVASIETGLAVLAHRKAVIGFADVLTIIAHRGLATAMPVLEASLDKLASETDRKAWCKAYFALRVPAIVELAATRYPASKGVAAAVAKYHKPPKGKKS